MSARKQNISRVQKTNTLTGKKDKDVDALANDFGIVDERDEQRQQIAAQIPIDQLLGRNRFLLLFAGADASVDRPDESASSKRCDREATSAAAS